MSLIQLDASGALDSAVGDRGISRRLLDELESRITEVHKELAAQRSRGDYGFYELYRDDGSFSECETAAAEFYAHGYENLVVLGIGGSALGLTALVTALKPPYYNLLDQDGRHGRPRVFVMDNVDPETFAQMLQLCSPQKTLFNVISKSGSTAETVAQLLLVIGVLEDAVGASSVRDHLVITTGPDADGTKATVLARVAEKYELRRFDVPENVGGRFSVFSPVGMFPAAVLGMNLGQFRAGCASMDAACLRDGVQSNPAYLFAALHYLGWRELGHSISIMMPYSDALRDVADWYRQLWAESLGKRERLNGQSDWFAGQTPVKALGVTDQHSQLQLYLEGPHDKLITVLDVERPRVDLALPTKLSGVEGITYLEGHSLGALLKAECNATVDALREAQRPVIRISMPAVNEHSVGQLLYLLEVATAAAGQLFEVDAFDQPAVERIKVLTRQYLRDMRG